MSYEYNKDEIKNNLTIHQIFDFLVYLDADPQMKNDNLIVSRTICHNGNHHKLYYYDNTHLFKCFTDCGETFDIYELVLKVKSHENLHWELPQAVNHVANFFHISKIETNFDASMLLQDWKVFSNYERINEIDIQKQIVELKEYDDKILTFLPELYPGPWLREGISAEVMKDRNIKYNPKSCGIVIPHYDQDNKLIGIRERTLVEENEQYGKYRPALINKQLYNHPLSFNLYNLNKSKQAISCIEKAIVFEGEKSCLLYASYFGMFNDISVACCGSSFGQYQAKLLIDAGAKEIVIAFDKQFQEKNDDEFKKLIKNLQQIHKKYGHYVKISFMFDKEDILEYKASPIDQGPEVFMNLFRKRIDLY